MEQRLVTAVHRKLRVSQKKSIFGYQVINGSSDKSAIQLQQLANRNC
jgi:ribosomal protein L22